jgi:hypothetical protein
MNKHGQMQSIGGMVMLGILLIVGLILIQGSAENISDVVYTDTIANMSLGVASNSTTVYLTDYKSISSVVVTNGTTGVVIGASNYTVTNKVPYNGGVAISILPTSPAAAGLTGHTWYINGVAEPLAYADSAGRSLSNLIIILMALALVAVAVGYAVKGINDMQ